MIGIGSAIVLSCVWMLVIGLVLFFLPVNADPGVAFITLACVLAIASAVVLDRYRRDPQAVRETPWRIEDRVLIGVIAACCLVPIWWVATGWAEPRDLAPLAIIVVAPAGRLLRRTAAASCWRQQPCPRAAAGPPGSRRRTRR